MVQPSIDNSADLSLTKVSLSRANSFSGTMSRTRSKRKQLTEHVRIITATHFLPYVAKVDPSTPHEPYAWTTTFRSGHTAMYAGIRSLNKNSETECLMTGWSDVYIDHKGREQPCDALSEESKDNLRDTMYSKHRAVPIFIESEVANGHYEGYSKKILWPLLHYMAWDDAQRPDPHLWESYIKVNQMFADTIASVYSKGDIVWVHDYHLLLLPRMLRTKFAALPIGLFLHAPFPSSELFRSLPERKEILDGMLGSTSVGFQTYSYARHFISSCTRALGLESTPTGIDCDGTMVSVGVFPIGIDVDAVQARRSTEGVQTKMKSIREMYAGKKIIIARDKLDAVSGIKQKLEAYEKFLATYTQWQDKVVLIQVMQPGQQRQPKLEAQISELVTHINSNYGSLEFVPIHYHHSFLNTDEYMALLNVADLCLITAIRDGMNTISLEYVVCQEDKHSPLILSEFTGTAGSISGAIMVNPWDYNEVAVAINSALSMSDDERRMRYTEVRKQVTSNTAQYWAKSFINDLRANVLAGQTAHVTPRLDVPLMVRQFGATHKRLIALDYDGTLTPITNVPAEALPPAEMIKALKQLCADARNSVWVISGRDREFLQKHLGGIVGLGMSAEHGSFIKYPDSDWINLLATMDMSWKADVLAIFEFYKERTEGSTIEAKETSITWHYRNADPEYGEFQCKECMNHLENAIVSKLPVEILVGKKCLEVRPIVVNKGEIIKRLLGNAPEEWEFVACAGDDKTDEDMFKALRAARNSIDVSSAAAATNGNGNGNEGGDDSKPYYFIITVGPKEKKTSAEWHVATSKDIVDGLTWLAAASR